YTAGAPGVRTRYERPPTVTGVCGWTVSWIVSDAPPAVAAIVPTPPEAPAVKIPLEPTLPSAGGTTLHVGSTCGITSSNWSFTVATSCAASSVPIRSVAGASATAVGAGTVLTVAGKPS